MHFKKPHELKKTEREYLIEILSTMKETTQSQLRNEIVTHEIASNVNAIAQEREEFRQKFDHLLEQVKLSGSAISKLLGRSNSRLFCQVVLLILYLTLCFQFIMRH